MIDVVLFGAGRMGKNHLRIIRENPRFRLVGVVDPVEKPVDGVPWFRSATEITDDFACAIVATPTHFHASVATELLHQGKDLLVEKPLASSSDEAAALCELAIAKGRKLAVGHVERFNPAVRKLVEVIRAGWLGEAIHCSFTRVGGYPNTLMKGNNVVLDLAVHDVDVFRLLSAPVELVASACHATWKPGLVDTAELLLRAENGMTANVHVNWVTPTKIRQIRVTGTKGVCFVDYILQTCELMGGNLLAQREAPDDVDFNKLLDLYKTSDRISFGVDKVEPLKMQLIQFANYLESNDPGELCVGVDAVNAVRITEQVR